VFTQIFFLVIDIIILFGYSPSVVYVFCFGIGCSFFGVWMSVVLLYLCKCIVQWRLVLGYL